MHLFRGRRRDRRDRGSSVLYRPGVLEAGAPLVSAQRRFTHVHVERASRKLVPIPDATVLQWNV
jgi:acyl-CoA thioesterase FadM